MKTEDAPGDFYGPFSSSACPGAYESDGGHQVRLQVQGMGRKGVRDGFRLRGSQARPWFLRIWCGTLCPAPRCAKLLLEAGATVNAAARDSEVTPLHMVAARGLEEHVALYLEHGADVGLRSSQGETALNAACAGAEGPGSGWKHQAAVRRLLEAGADARVAGHKRHTPLHNACANGCGALAELLLRHGACAGVPNAAGHTPMDCALQAVQDVPNWEPEVLFMALLDYGAQPAHPEVRRESLEKEAPAG